MLATISSLVFDFSGYIELDLINAYTDGEIRRRVNRSPTLDGGAVVSDGGFSHGDRTLALRWERRDKDVEESVARMVQTYSYIAVSTRAGVFRATPEAYNPSADESELRLLVLEKLSA
jgi:hypothetical protein